MKKIPVLVYTDIGDDIDDSLALTYLAGCKNIQLVGIVCGHNNIPYRVKTTHHLCDSLGYTVPIWGGFSGKGKYKIHPDLSSFLKKTLETYSKNLVILAIGPTTDLYHHLQTFPTLFSKINHIYFQGQVLIKNTHISPDFKSYNFAQDRLSIKGILKHTLPMTFVSKYLAYQIPLTTEDFEQIKTAHHPLGKFLSGEAHKRRKKLQKLSPAVFERLFGNSPTILSYPYDLITAAAITEKDMFIVQKKGNISLLGHRKNVRSIKNIAVLKKHLFSTILKTLQ